MALEIFDRYAPRANPSSSEYPHGSIKNESVPGANDGTPLESDWGNDYVGFDAALFAAAGISPSGDPDTALESQRLEALNKLYEKTVNSISELSAVSILNPGRVVFVSGYYADSPGVGGGNFIEIAGSKTPDGGSIISSATSGRYWLRISPQKTPYEFGFIDGDADVSVTANACSIAYGECRFHAGKTYNQQKQINAIKLGVIGGGIATLNLISPTSDGKWGSPTSGFVNTAAVLCLGAAGNPLKGVDIQGIKINCNNMLNSSGTVGIKGFMLTRCESFYQRGCKVYNSPSYGFWDNDVLGDNTTYCSGTREDCYAEDCAVSFEQVNVKGITLNNCTGILTGAALPFTVENIFHPYGLAGTVCDMQVVYNNCVGIAESGSVCPSIMSVLLECENITANDCQFINKDDGGASARFAVLFENAGGNFNRINFNNCVLRSDYWAAVALTVGANGSTGAHFYLNDCEIRGKSIAFSTLGNGGNYFITQPHIVGTSISGNQAYGIFNGATGALFNVVGGEVTGTGGTLPQSSNLPESSFSGTRLTPATGLGPRKIRQQFPGSVTLNDSGSYASAVIGFQFAALNLDKVELVAHIIVDGPGSPAYDAAGEIAAAAYAYPICFRPATPGNLTNFRIYATTDAAAGKKVRYTLTEYE